MTKLLQPFSLKLPERFDSDAIETAKGILILLVIFGHASNFWTPEPFATFSIKFFHVACFLLLPFIYDVRGLSKNFIKDRFARYYIPFAFFLIGYSILYLIAIRGFGDVLPWIGDVGKAFFFGTAPFLDDASGLRALWFLPVLISIVLLNALFIGTLKWRILPLLIIGLVIHVTIGLLETPEKFYLPIGSTAALYLLWIGFIIRLICSVIPKSSLQKLSPIFLILFLSGMFAANYFDTLIKFPVLALPHIETIKALIIHDTIIISAFLFLITTPLFKNMNALKWCGENSLTLYLTHLLFLAACMQFTTKNFDVDVINLHTIGIVIGIFAVSLSGGIICVLILNKWQGLKNLIMPRDWDNWTLTKKTKS